MSEERAAKSKLKRRKGPIVPDVQGSVSGLQFGKSVPARRSSTGSWFDEIDLTAAEQMWRQVLKAAFPDLQSVGWGAVPRLPDFGNKIVRNIKENDTLEVFMVGQKQIEWIPLPKYVEEQASDQGCVKKQDDGVIYDEKNKMSENVLHTRPPKPSLDTVVQIDKIQKVDQCVTNSEQKKQAVTMKSSTKNLKEPKLATKQSLLKLSSIKASQIKSRPSAQKVEEAHRKETNTDVIMLDISDEDIGPSTSTAQKVGTCPDKAEEGPGSLVSCPMCLMEFPKQLSQLDIDSHLAQCLSETTVDILW
ncbi:Fanconi anemia core complex-associated protein 20 [Discoglossus pictus]